MTGSTSHSHEYVKAVSVPSYRMPVQHFAVCSFGIGRQSTGWCRPVRRDRGSGTDATVPRRMVVRPQHQQNRPAREPGLPRFSCASPDDVSEYSSFCCVTVVLKSPQRRPEEVRFGPRTVMPKITGRSASPVCRGRRTSGGGGTAMAVRASMRLAVRAGGRAATWSQRGATMTRLGPPGRAASTLASRRASKWTSRSHTWAGRARWSRRIGYVGYASFGTATAITVGRRLRCRCY